MSEKNETTFEIMEESNVVFNGVHKVFLFGLGLVSSTTDQLDNVQTEASKLFSNLVERGEALETDGRKVVGDIVERRKSQAKNVTGKAETELDKRIESIINRMQMPTRNDIQELGKKVNSLNRKIDALKKQAAE